MILREPQTDHFMVGQEVSVLGETGTIETVIDYTFEVEGERKTKKRVIVDVGDREINASSDDVEVVQ